MPLSLDRRATHWSGCLCWDTAVQWLDAKGLVGWELTWLGCEMWIGMLAEVRLLCMWILFNWSIFCVFDRTGERCCPPILLGAWPRDHRLLLLPKGIYRKDVQASLSSLRAGFLQWVLAEQAPRLLPGMGSSRASLHQLLQKGWWPMSSSLEDQSNTEF